MSRMEPQGLTELLGLLGLDEEPMGLGWFDQPPAGCLSPKPLDLPTREKEQSNQIDWQAVFGGFSCVMGHIWRARKKRAAACFSARQFGCPGGAFWLGFLKPQTETIINYVSTGIPNWTQGERYYGSPEELRRAFAQVDPPPAPKLYCVVQPVSAFSPEDPPELVIFFARPESLSGLHQLATFVTNDPEAVASPWGAGCGSIAAWPRHYLAQGRSRAVLGGWDPSARKYYATDELSFTVPWAMFTAMLAQYGQSFLTTKTWATVGKKIDRSKRAWSKA